MNAKDISTIRRFIGVVEGVSSACPNSAQSLIFDYILIVDKILEEEEWREEDEKGGVE